MCFQGVYRRCGWGKRLVLHWAESCKGLRVQLPHKLLVCSNFCDCKHNFKHQNFMCICCTYPFVSFILTTSKSISGQGRKMNMNSYPSWHRYVKKISMHILMLIFCRKYVILVSCNKPQNLISWQHWYRPSWPVTRVYKRMLYHGFSKDLLLLLVLNLSTETKNCHPKDWAQ
jgi:hypothetical protein